jgi:serine/threonine protein kinase
VGATPEEVELVQFLGRSFPSLASLNPAEGQKRAEALGLFAASLAAGGTAALAARGLSLPAELEAPLGREAARVAQARAGGAALLARIRAQLGDGPFARWITTVAQLFRASQEKSVTGTVAAVPQAAPLRELGGFEIVAQLGEGAMGKVWKARQRSLDRFVALKILSQSLALDQDFVRRFHSEARAAAKLSHPNIAGVIDQGTDPATGLHYIAFEFINGPTLEEVLRAQKRLGEAEALAIARGLASALAAAEQAGIVHRDVKPENVLLARDPRGASSRGEPKLVDLGLAKKRDETSAASSAGVVIGTPAYMSPEQAMGFTDIDHRADLYALGMTLFRMLTGRLAYEAETPTAFLLKHVNDRCPDPRTFEPQVSEPAARIVLKLSAREREVRYASATEAVQDLDLVLAGKPPIFALPIDGSSAPSTGRVTPRPGTGGGVPDEPPWAEELVPARIPDALAPAGSPDPTLREGTAAAPLSARSDPSALLRSLERASDPDEIARAFAALQERVSAANRDRNRVAAAQAEATLARAHLVRGDRVNSERRAQSALEKDPSSREATLVLARLARGDAERSKLETGLARIRFEVSRARFDDARAVAEGLREAFPQEPHPWLALTAIARLKRDEAAFVDGLRRAWSLYPSRERADAGLGGLDGLVCDLLVAHGRSAYRGDGSLLKQTVEGLDEKSNLIAGALRIAIASARVALERGGLSLFEQRRLHFAVARSLASLRRYDAALDELARATQFHPSEPELACFESEKTFIQYMKHMDGRAGAQPRYRCLGALALIDLARARLAVATRERAARAFEIEKAGVAAAALAGKDPAAKAELRTAAEKAGDKEVFALLDPAEQELADIARERASSKETSPRSEAKTGFLGKLKGMADAAAAGVAGAAREAQLKLREAQANARYESAAKRFAQKFGKELAAHEYAHAELAALARRAASHAAALEYYADEDARAKKEIERLVPLA